MTLRRLAIAIVAITLLAGAGVAGAYAYERARGSEIADGITIAGVDVGGLDAAAAQQKVEQALAPGLRRPVVVHSLHGWFRLDRRDLGVQPQLDPAIQAALARSQSGSFLKRAWRDLFGQANTNVPLVLGYSSAKVDRLIQGVQRSVDRRPKSASLQVSLSSLHLSPGHDGVRVQTGFFRRALVGALLRRKHTPVVRVPTRVLHPKLSTGQVLRQNATYITIDRAAKRLRLFKGLRLYKTYTIAVGRVGLETPAGHYRIQDKQVNPSWHVPNSSWAGSLAGQVIPPGPDDPLKARWLGIYDGAGIHGTDELSSLGTAASHGCIRMSIPDVIQLYGLVPIGTPVYIL